MSSTRLHSTIVNQGTNFVPTYIVLFSMASFLGRHEFPIPYLEEGQGPAIHQGQSGFLCFGK